MGHEDALVPGVALVRLGSDAEELVMLYARNPERRAKTRARNYGDPHPERGDTRADRVRAMPCLGRRVPAGGGWVPLHVCRTPVQAAHVDARGMGGRGGDARKLAPLCADAHREAGELPSLWMRSSPERYATTQRGAWEARHGVDLLAEAERIAVELDAEGYP